MNLLARLRPLAYALLVCVALISLGQELYYWPRLPAQVASRFGANGAALDFMPKHQYTALLLGLKCFLLITLLATSWLVRVLPTTLINVPQREFWLTGDRRPLSLRAIEGYTSSVAVTVQLLMITLSHLVFCANVQPNAFDSQQGLIVVGGFLVLVGALTGVLFWTFARRPDASRTP